MPDIGERLAAIAGEETRSKVFQGFMLPPLGSPQENYPKITKRIMDKMLADLPSETSKKILTWNYHKVPVEVKLLESVLKGDMYCRFANKTPKGEMK